jgi:hypothetical protein
VNEGELDWRRLAEPQGDAYDTRAIRAVAASDGRQFYAPPSDSLPVEFVLDGAVPVLHVRTEPPHPSTPHGPLSHPNLSRASALLRHWPEAFRQCQSLISVVHPLWYESVGQNEAPLLSASSADQEWLGVIYVTVIHPMSLAEAMVHELAHVKLLALGVSLERAARLITNPPDELYESPLVRNRLRPLPAVLHAFYASVHMLELNLRTLDAGVTGSLRENALTLLADNLPRTERGLEVLAGALTLDVAGEAFVEGLFAWAASAIERGRETLERAHLGPDTLTPLPHAVSSRRCGLPIVLVGPRGAGKSTLAEALARALELPLRSADVEALSIYRSHPVVAAIDGGSATGDEASRIRAVFERLRTQFGDDFEEQLHLRVARELLVPTFAGVIDLGAGHTTYADAERRRAVEGLLRALPNVVLIVPSDDREHAIDTILARRRGTEPELTRAIVERELGELAGAAAATMVVSTGRHSIEETTLQILERLA